MMTSESTVDNVVDIVVAGFNVAFAMPAKRYVLNVN